MQVAFRREKRRFSCASPWVYRGSHCVNQKYELLLRSIRASEMVVRWSQVRERKKKRKEKINCNILFYFTILYHTENITSMIGIHLGRN